MQTPGNDDPGAPASPAPAYRYWAFISYSHKDERQAARLHRQLEGYTAHTRLLGTGAGRTEALPKRIFPVFRDRDELVGASDLSENIEKALRESRFLIVVCSPHAARSRWVDEEIRSFKRLGGEARVLAFIVDGEPNASDDPQAAALECFPEGLRYRMGSDGTLTGERTEPVAADARKGGDGPRHALLKLIAGILAVGFDDLRRRDHERSARRRNWITAASLGAAGVFAGIAAYAYYQQTIATERSRVALSRQLAAQALNEVPAPSAPARPSDYALGLLLAVEALQAAPTVEARTAVLKAVLASPHRLRYLWGHTATVTSAGYAPDGTLYATAGGDGSVVLWDARTHRPLGPLAGPQGAVRSLAFSPRGDVLATGHEDGAVTLWQLRTRQPLGARLTGPQQAVLSLAFNADGSRLAAGGGGEAEPPAELFVWDLASGGPARRPASDSDLPHPTPIESVAFSPDGKTLLSASGDGAMAIWDAGSLAPLRTWKGQIFSCAAFSRDGRLLATGGRSGMGTRRIAEHPYGLLVWELATGQPRGVGSPPEIDDVRSVAFGPGDILASGSPDGRVMLWSAEPADRSPEPVGPPLSGHKEAVTALAFSPDGRTLLSGSVDGAVIWRDREHNAPLGRPLDDVRGRKAAEDSPFYALDGIALTSDGKTMASQSAGGRIILWDVASGAPRRELAGSGAAATALAFTADGRTLAAGTSQGVVFWDVESGRSHGPPTPHEGTIDPRALSPDGKSMALRMPDHAVRLWDIAARAATATAWGGVGIPRTDPAFSPDGAILASGRADGAVDLWSVAQQSALEPPLPGHQGGVETLSFSRDGTMLAVAASRDRRDTVTLWDLGRRARRDLPWPKGHTIDLLAFGPTGRVLVAAARSGDLLLWDVARGGARRSLLAGHSDPVLAVGFSADEGTLVSVDANGTAILWDLGRRLIVGSLQVGHPQGVRSAAFSGDARVMASSSLWTSGLIVTDWDPDSWARAACETANRRLTLEEWRRFVAADADYQPACAAAAPPPR